MPSKFDLILNRTVFIAGSDKNAGKTSFLNLVLSRLRSKTKLAYLTIGVDGEKADQVFGTPKPRILAVEGDYLVTTDLMLKESSGSFQILAAFPSKTVLGRLVLALVIRSGYIELVGAEDNSGLANILQYLKNEQQISTILVDGAVNRVTQVAAGDDAAFVFVSRINRNNFNSTIEKLKIINLLSDLPVYNTNGSSENSMQSFPGALTSTKLKALPQECSGLVLEDFTRFFLTYEELKKLLSRMPVCLQNHLELLYFQVNNYDVSREEIKNALAGTDIYSKIIFNPYQKHNL